MRLSLVMALSCNLSAGAFVTVAPARRGAHVRMAANGNTVADPDSAWEVDNVLKPNALFLDTIRRGEEDAMLQLESLPQMRGG